MSSASVVMLCLQDTYFTQSFYHRFPYELADLRTLQGTNRYCEAEAEAALTGLLKRYPLKAIHLLGSGNYHYLSAVWTGFIDQPFQLLVYDHHTDMQPPAFGDILSCGSWVLRVIDTNPYLRKVILAGPDQASYEQTPVQARSKVAFISQERLACEDGNGWQEIAERIEPDLPLYVSVDKDILGKLYAHTGWSQGETTLEQLTGSLETILRVCADRGQEVLGADLCGEAEQADPDFAGVNEYANEQLVSLLYRYLRSPQ
ncbi:MAG: arginase family protein [Blautia sp.]|nr:arginase family protein [Blautia sp.]